MSRPKMYQTEEERVTARRLAGRLRNQRYKQRLRVERDEQARAEKEFLNLTFEPITDADRAIPGEPIIRVGPKPFVPRFEDGTAMKFEPITKASGS
jgi:hypothetical protein